MDKFPDDLTITKCREEMEKKQFILLRETRDSFYTKIQQGIQTCQQIIELQYPKNLWNKYKKKILEELLKRFGEVKIVTIQDKTVVTRLTDNIEDVNQALDKIIIEFFEN